MSSNIFGNYTQTDVIPSSNGDGMVLFGSATYGDTNYGDTVFLFDEVEHVELVSNSAVLDQIVALIELETGVNSVNTLQKNLDAA